MRLVEALGDLVDVPQFFVWRMTWVAAKRKYEKTPYYVDPEGKGRDNWMDYQAAIALLAALRATGGTYTLGWYLTADTGYWFFDIDGRTDDDVALWARANLQGAFCEVSSSGNGLHFIGHGPVPRHSMVNKAAALELYTEGRGIAFAMSDEAEGCADADCTQAIAAVAAHWFPYVEVVHVEGADPLWRGPADDEELLRRALQSGSVGSILGNRASFADLWNRNVSVLAKVYPPDPGSVDPFGGSEADGALAMQLAFWTGRDVARVERLMRRSALARDKWDSERGDTTYLGFTVARACGGVSGVLQDKELVQKLGVATTEDARANVDLWEQKILKADESTLRNDVMPAICADSTIAMLDRERLAAAVQKWFKQAHDMKLPIRECRRMLTPVAEKVENEDAKDFAKEHVYVEQNDLFFHVPSATMLTRTAFQAKFNREMPTRTNGDAEDAAKWSLDRWHMPTVHDTMYLPGREQVFGYQGRQYANLYSPSSVPTPCEVSHEGAKSICVFARHLELFCGSRADVYGGMLAWMAFNVQNPGRKIRFAPILKGIPGDGKSLIVNVMAAAMGERNVSVAGPSIVMNSGGFTDWAHGACVIGMEEMMMQGRSRYAIANAIKENITNGRVTINRKGKGQLPIINVSNFICFTNHSNAIPLEDEDRRWWVIFSPFERIADVAKAHGVERMSDVYDAVWDLVYNRASELRAWLMSIPVPAWFDPDGHAPWTPEKESMRGGGDDEDHAIARQVVETGSYGVSVNVLSSACLTKAMRAVCVVEGVDVPQGKKVTQMITDMGYRWLGIRKWKGQTHRIWVRNAVSEDTFRAHLDATVTVSGSVTLPPITVTHLKPLI